MIVYYSFNYIHQLQQGIQDKNKISYNATVVSSDETDQIFSNVLQLILQLLLQTSSQVMSGVPG